MMTNGGLWVTWMHAIVVDSPQADIQCTEHEEGKLHISYRPTEPGFYIMNVKVRVALSRFTLIKVDWQDK